MTLKEYQQKIADEFGISLGSVCSSKFVEKCYYMLGELTNEELKGAAEEILRLRDGQRKLEKEANATIYKYRAEKDGWTKRYGELQALNDEIMQFETAEMRDRYRMAKRYDEMAYCENQYQRTEYNKGIALIMAGINQEAKLIEEDE